MADELKSRAAYAPKNAWSVYKDEAARKDVRAFCDSYIDFLSRCKTERETVAFCRDFLRARGFGDDPKGNAYVTSLNGKCLFAFKKGTRPLKEGVRLIIAHADCPRLDFKPHPIVEQAGFAQA